MVEVERISVNMDKKSLSIAKPIVVVGIPAYNEEKTIARVVLESQKVSDLVLVCNDGSDDLTEEIAESLGAKVIRHNRNVGYGAAIRSLFNSARELGADVLVTLDADGQHNPAEIPEIVKPIIQGTADISIGSRFMDTQKRVDMPLYRKLGIEIITRLVNGSSRTSISDAQSGFRAYNRKAIDSFKIVETGMGASVEILLEAIKNGLTICEVPSTCKYKSNGEATSTKHPIKHGINVVMSLALIAIRKRR
jgi:glycosyltransferase involved in cell wall biosynthesis